MYYMLPGTGHIDNGCSELVENAFVNASYHTCKTDFEPPYSAVRVQLAFCCIILFAFFVGNFAGNTGKSQDSHRLTKKTSLKKKRNSMIKRKILGKIGLICDKNATI